MKTCKLATVTRTMCGRRPKRGQHVFDWVDVTCRDCQAARDADEVPR